MYPKYRESKAKELSHINNQLIEESFYGLPIKVYFCENCTLSNQRPCSAIEYDHIKSSKKSTVPIIDGICDACKIHSLKHSKDRESIDWKAREKELFELAKKYKRSDGYYDCLVPGSGGKDSIYTSYLLKYKYGMNPLTVTWAPHIYTDWGRKNMDSWIASGVDNYLFTPNSKVHRLLTRIALEEMFHPFQPFIIGQKAFAPAFAAKLGIKLIFWGEAEAEDGNPIAEYNTPTQDWKYFAKNELDKVYLSGKSLTDLINKFGLSKEDLTPYLPVNPDLLMDKEIDIRYMGYYERWHPQHNYYFAAQNTGFEAAPERTAGTYNKYSGIDDKIDDFHYYTTYIKFGIGRATYDSAQESRNGDITRDEAVSLVHKYDGEFPSRFCEEIFEYLSINYDDFPEAYKNFEEPNMNKDYFTMLSDSFRSPHLWRFNNAKNEWELRYKINV